MDRDSGMSNETLAVHAGIGKFQFNPVVPPIYQVSTFAFDDAAHGEVLFAGGGRGYIYSRMGNPTVEALERSIAALEGGYGALACSSGMAAIHTALGALLHRGDHIVCSNAVYGPTCCLIENYLERFDIESTMVDTSDPDAVERAFRPNTRILYVETPCNPTLVLTDLEVVCQLGHERGATVVVDNTFMGPILQRPFRWGADVVVHSLTKCLNGHADVVGGAVVVRNRGQYDEFRQVLNVLGGVLSPLESFLVHRGIKTLALRVRQHCDNALKIAEFLENHPAVARVNYPGLRSHPQYDLARKQTGGGGAVVSFELRSGVEAARRMMDAVELFALAVSLGGVESLIEHPASMTHASMGKAARERGRISDGLIRISVGIENADDLIGDLDQALEVATQPRASGQLPSRSLAWGGYAGIP